MLLLFIFRLTDLQKIVSKGFLMIIFRYSGAYIMIITSYNHDPVFKDLSGLILQNYP